MQGACWYMDAYINNFKPLLDPGGGFISETATRRFQKRNGRYITAPEAAWLNIYNGYM